MLSAALDASSHYQPRRGYPRCCRHEPTNSGPVTRSSLASSSGSCCNNKRQTDRVHAHGVGSRSAFGCGRGSGSWPSRLNAPVASMTRSKARDRREGLRAATAGYRLVAQVGSQARPGAINAGHAGTARIGAQPQPQRPGRARRWRRSPVRGSPGAGCASWWRTGGVRRSWLARVRCCRMDRRARQPASPADLDSVADPLRPAGSHDHSRHRPPGGAYQGQFDFGGRLFSAMLRTMFADLGQISGACRLTLRSGATMSARCSCGMPMPGSRPVAYLMPSVIRSQRSVNAMLSAISRFAELVLFLRQRGSILTAQTLQLLP